MQITESVPALFTPMSLELLEAARSGDTNILGTSIPDVHVTAGGNSMLHIAAKKGHTDFCNEALDLQPFLLQLKNARGDTPLHVAARAGHHQVVNDLISTASERSAQGDDGVGSLVQMANDVGNTALHEAVQNGHEQVVDALVAKAPGVSAVTNNVNGVSPLFMAVECESVPIVRRLLEAGEASCDGPNGQTALHSAVLRSYNITKILLEERPRLLKKADNNGNSPLHFAASVGGIEMVKLLLEKDASIASLQDNDGASAIHVAARCGHVTTIKHLHEVCPDCVELMDNQGRSFLHVAIEKEREMVIRYVLRSPDIVDLLNQPDKKGNTPLHAAALSGNLAITRMLSSNKNIKKRAMNNEGHTALDVTLRSTPADRVYTSSMVLLLLTNGSRFSPRRLDAITDRLLMQREKDPKNETLFANNMSVTAVLVATVAFAAAFTLPGGYKSDESNDPGMPILLKRTAFKVFLIFDTLALTTSVLVLLLLLHVGLGSKIYKNRYLPNARLMLQISLEALMVAFASGLYPLIAGEDFWLFILICVFISISFLYFILDQPLFLYFFHYIWGKCTSSSR
ncbi:ankyrin repeat-containing protein NPR4-like [Musa acuminata AAA Group]|uniref:ankyrin repeat-containing protein NPR4-like n=1 Tax=Musa acuminata AAA Group TaxID=214697 RepID=UPI0031D36318